MAGFREYCLTDDQKKYVDQLLLHEYDTGVPGESLGQMESFQQLVQHLQLPVNNLDIHNIFGFALHQSNNEQKAVLVIYTT